jgi:phytoene synthase
MTLLIDTLRLQRDFDHTAEVTRLHSRTFYTATALLPAKGRRAIRALYAFCRMTDDLVDNKAATSTDVDRWRASAARPAHDQDDPVLRSWAHIRDHYGVDLTHQNELIDGVHLDLVHNRYATWAELERYCYLVASTVGLMSIPIVGLAPGVTFERAAPYAIKLGVALQLTNILRDVGEDAARGRVYFPAEDLHRFDLSAEDILRGVHDARFVGLMRFEIARARHLFSEALPGITLLAPGARLAVGAAALLYRAILDEIEGLEYRVHTQRAHTTTMQKLTALPGIYWTVQRLTAP